MAGDDGGIGRECVWRGYPPPSRFAIWVPAFAGMTVGKGGKRVCAYSAASGTSSTAWRAFHFSSNCLDVVREPSGDQPGGASR